MRVYKTFAEVDRTLPNGALIRIIGNPEPYWDGVYRIRKAKNAQGFTWGARVFPGPYRYHYIRNYPALLREWPANLPPRYAIPGVDEDEDL